MVNFEESFNKGILAAEKAEFNRNEILDVFNELNKQLEGPTKGKLLVHRKELYESSNPFKVAIFEKRATYLAITAENPQAEDSSHKQLAKWSQEPNGYPCKISFGTKEMYCDDKESLAEALSVLLEDSVVGEKILGIINRPEALETDK